MATGFSLGVLQMQKEITQNATPAYKIEPYGLLASLMMAHSPGKIKKDSMDGHFKNVIVKAKTRTVIGDTSTAAGACDVSITNPYVETSVDVTNTRSVAFRIDDETIAAFDSYASANKVIAGAQPATPLMFEFYDTLMTMANGLLTGVNSDLVTLAVAAFGKHRATGTTTAVAVNIPLTTTTNPLNDGVSKILKDLKANTMMGKPIVVGAGLFASYMMQQAAKGLDQTGLDTRIQSAMFDFFYDDTFATAAGANHIGVWEKDSIQLVEYLQYQGFKAGEKGKSIFGTLPLPMQVGDQLVPVWFDYQLRYNDCPEVITLDGAATTTVQKGWNLILSKKFGLYTIPTTAYKASDPLTGNRGSLRFNITNT